MEGRKEGRKEGREGRKEGRKEGSGFEFCAADIDESSEDKAHKTHTKTKTVLSVVFFCVLAAESFNLRFCLMTQ